ncbi:unnamed protein product [Menidia menidia]|uniref:(Atlantic silverside) hypothetical protein n=1 Tax=Menidia menidia TaxID=238744 RepID=A0A8S4BY41_9TELE|nr:unnamed protein product [Menidia menidia]
MDIVDTFNHLTPSDQLDDSPIISQNLECEANNECGTGLGLEDSLKNMLSDKDPMFGCASTLLDNEDPAFQIAGSASPDSGAAQVDLSNEPKTTESSQDKRLLGKQKKPPGSLEYRQYMINILVTNGPTCLPTVQSEDGQGGDRLTG